MSHCLLSCSALAEQKESLARRAAAAASRLLLHVCSALAAVKADQQVGRDSSVAIASSTVVLSMHFRACRASFTVELSTVFQWRCVATVVVNADRIRLVRSRRSVDFLNDHVQRGG